MFLFQKWQVSQVQVLELALLDSILKLAVICVACASFPIQFLPFSQSLQDFAIAEFKSQNQANSAFLARATRCIYMLGPEPRCCSQSSDTIIHSAGRYSEESSRIFHRINNIFVKPCEKHINSAQNSIKATDIRTNATDVESKPGKTLFNKHKSPTFTMDLT